MYLKFANFYSGNLPCSSHSGKYYILKYLFLWSLPYKANFYGVKVLEYISDAKSHSNYTVLNEVILKFYFSVSFYVFTY